MERDTSAKLFFDLDGTIVDTNMNDEGTAKWRESFEMVLELTKERDPKKFRRFYLAFNEKAMGLYMDDASKLFASMLNEEYGTSVSEEYVISYRREKRMTSYKSSVEFIGNQQTNNGFWLGKIPKELMRNSWLVTSSPREAIVSLQQNPKVRINEKAFNDFFEDRIITSTEVKKKKPDSESYETAMKNSNAFPNKKGFSGIAFEDSFSGLLSAKRARYNKGKLYVVGIGSTKSSKELKENGAHITFKSLYEVDLRAVLKEAGF